eukprot:c11677_g2_i1.p3 GENE.c11677_g2_i1~~c11677_g2_i1.p3  ORF type:complete len:110 (+),score=5.36 c11677_g2_i1:523-852(+)
MASVCGFILLLFCNCQSSHRRCCGAFIYFPCMGCCGLLYILKGENVSNGYHSNYLLYCRCHTRYTPDFSRLPIYNFIIIIIIVTITTTVFIIFIIFFLIFFFFFCQSLF